MRAAKLLIAIGFWLAAAASLSAHPMGNFSISHYARFDVRPEGVTLTYALDLAELPTFELLENWSTEARDREAVTRRAVNQARSWLSGLQVRAGGRNVVPEFQRADAYVTEGAGALPVLRVVVIATLPAPEGPVEYEDTNYPSRAGWKEIVIVPHPGVQLLAASQGPQDLSRALETYPSDVSLVPPQATRASFRWAKPEAKAPSDVATAPSPRLQSLPPAPRHQQTNTLGTVVRGDYLSRMLGGGEITLPMILIGICAAFGLGAMHALSPGHGKTIVAAYLVGSRGTLKHALFLGATVTFTHTASVFALGIGVLFFERYVVPDRVIPILGALSGLSIVVIGLILLLQRAKALAASGGGHHHHHEHGHTHEHPHEHDHQHEHHHHHDHSHGHDHGHNHLPAGPVSLGGLIALGVSGGLVPCPSALVLLLSSIALGRAGLGLILLTGFSAGLALVLMAIGAMVLYAKNLLPGSGRLAATPAFRYIPVLSAAVVMMVGLLMTGVSLGWIQPGSFPG